MSINEWEDQLDLGLAVRNLRDEQLRDWHQDPWGWPELKYIESREPALVYDCCRSSGCQRVSVIDVPKPNWGSRPAVVLANTDRLMYQALVDNESLNFTENLSADVFGWRLPLRDPKAGVYSNNSFQWRAYVSHLKWLGAILHRAVLRTDIVSFFESVPIEKVQENIQDRSSGHAVQRRLCDFLGGFQDIPYRSGLPQRSRASAVLANMYLEPLDVMLSDHSDPVPVDDVRRLRFTYKGYSRWMDDIYLFTRDAGRSRRAQVELQTEARTLGLNLNASKTAVIEGEKITELIQEIEHSAVDDEIGTNNNFVPLEDLINRALEAPELAVPHSVRFAATRMRKHQRMYRIRDLLESSGKMPHVADSLAGLFVYFGDDQKLELTDWFLEYIHSQWAAFDWSVAWYSRVFSSGTRNKKIEDEFSRIVTESNASIPLFAVACQRLAAWNKDKARAAFREAQKRERSPHERRIMVLAALQAGEVRSIVRPWLSGDKENYPTLRMLEYMNFSPLPCTEDYLLLNESDSG